MRKLKLVIKGLRKTLEHIQIGPLDFEVPKGVTVLLGPNGAGKTTVLNLITGIIKADAGNITLNGLAIGAYPPERRKLGYVFTGGALFPHLNVEQNVFYGKPTKNDAAEAMQLLGIDNLRKKGINHLSGGEKQRVAIARTLATRPEAILLDEPLAHLDLVIREKLREELGSLLRKLGVPVLYVTHYKNDVSTFADRIIIFEKGQISHMGLPSAVEKTPQTPFAARFFGFTNFIPCTLKKIKDDLSYLEADGIELVSTGCAEIGEELIVAIKGSDIFLSRQAIVSSAQNSVPVKITKTREEGSLFQVRGKCGNTELESIIIASSGREMRLIPGETVYFHCKATNVALIKS